MGTSTLIDKRGKAGGSTPPAKPPEGDEPIELYAKRKQIYPKLVFGKFRNLKWFLLVVTLGIYYVLPWIRWDRGTGVPDQAVLADFAGGRFYFFWLEIWPQEVFYITGLLILAAVGLFLVTALLGRVWCGYFCPQTVWTDLFLVVERFFEGDRNARIKLDKAPMSLNKAWRKTGKHTVWLLISFATGGAFILYWHDAPTLAQTFFTGQAPMTAYVFAALLTGTTYALAGTMREQVCTYMCPWPRIQAAMTDQETLAVTYRSERGDPRGPHKKGESWEGRGDCIDCKQCVVVCPMGIDIRQGLQLECIGCGLCIDACDDVMKKVGRPTGLIAYDTDQNVVLRWMKHPAKKLRIFRPRIIVYGAVFAITGAIMVVGLSMRSDMDLSVLKDRGVPFVQLSTGEIRNAYTLKVINKTHMTRDLTIGVEGLPQASVEIIGTGDGAARGHLSAEPDVVERLRLLITAPAADVAGGRDIRLVLTDPKTGTKMSAAARFEGPEASQ